MGALIPAKSDDRADELRDDGAFVFHFPPKFLWQQDPDEADTPIHWKNYHLYIHVPFCRKICTFCTFERRQLRKGAIDWFTTLLDKEMDIYQERDDFSEANIQSVYLGGGTGSLLSNATIQRVVHRLNRQFGLNSELTEVTLETEPGTKTLADLQAIRKSGVNRISIGAQAFDDEQLKLLNRSHSVRQTLQTISAAKQSGFTNIHLDIMYGLPGQTMNQWKNTVQMTIDIAPSHVSAYPLIVFPNELLDRSLNQDVLPKRPDPELINEMRLFATEQFKNAGLIRYSTAEFALPGYECRYVKSTWDSSNYLGFGPGAYSRHNNVLWEDNVIHPTYERKIFEGKKPTGKRYVMSPTEQLQRDIAMGLCLLEIDIDCLSLTSGQEFIDQFLNVANDLISLGLIGKNGSKIFLTEEGIRYATYVMKRFTNW